MAVLLDLGTLPASLGFPEVALVAALEEAGDLADGSEPVPWAVGTVTI